MNEPMPALDSTLAEVARWIRTVCPIVGATATDEDCRIRAGLIAEALQTRGVEPAEYRWFTAQLADGRVAGGFADSLEEAELQISVWWAHSCHWVVEDAEYHVYEEYFPHGKRGQKDHARAFPLAPPRKPRDRFAPATSLLDSLDLGAPASCGGEIGGLS